MCLLSFCARQFIVALWSPAGKGWPLGSRLWCLIVSLLLLCQPRVEVTSCFVYKVMGLTFHNKINTPLIYRFELAQVVARGLQNHNEIFLGSFRFESHWLLFFIHFYIVFFFFFGGWGVGSCLIFFLFIYLLLLFLFFIPREMAKLLCCLLIHRLVMPESRILTSKICLLTLFADISESTVVCFVTDVWYMCLIHVEGIIK